MTINPAHHEFVQTLFERRILIDTGVRGVYGRTSIMTGLVARLQAAIDVFAQLDAAEHVFFPPVIPREVLRKTGYMENFPQLCGSVHAFGGTDREHAPLVDSVRAGGDWSPHLSQTDVVLTPAGCYPLYPTLSGRLPAGGRTFDLDAFCFRHEPSDDPARLQSFELRENIRLGHADEVMLWRSTWMERAPTLLHELGLDARLDTAADPFFGRGGRMMKATQQAQQLKFELLVPIWSADEPTAVASFNYHGEHFGHTFDIHTADDGVAHSACIGFGIDRLALALIRRHGFALEQWPTRVRARLWP